MVNNKSFDIYIFFLAPVAAPGSIANPNFNANPTVNNPTVMSNYENHPYFGNQKFMRYFSNFVLK